MENIKTMLSTINYGSITLVVQDNLVVQIEKNEKIRLK
ncbi:YezD family protein [Sporosarcina limicola]